MAFTRHSHFLAHSSDVNCLHFGRKSGQVAATGGDDMMVNLWRMREKETKNILSLSGHQSAVESITFDPSEKKVAAGSKAGSIKMFDLEAGKVSRSLKGHMSTCTTIDHHLYGEYVASGSLDTIVKVWDLKSKACMQTFKGHVSEVTKVSFTPDGRWLTSGGIDGTIKIWDLTAGRLLKEFNGHTGAITCLEFNPEEFILVSASADKTIRFWDVQDFSLIGVTPTDNAATTCISHTVTPPYCGKYAVCSSQEAVRIWSYENAIECHDTALCQRFVEVSTTESHADTVVIDDMKLMGGSIESAFVSVWVLDLSQLRPFCLKSKKSRTYPSITKSGNHSVPKLNVDKPSHPEVASSEGIHLENMKQPGLLSSKPLVCNVSASSIQHFTSNESTSVEHHSHLESNNFEVPKVKDDVSRAQNLSTTDYLSELKCGQETCLKTFKARQSNMEQFLVHWEKGNIREGLTYVSGLSGEKRTSLLVDILRVVDLHAACIDLDACLILLPLLVELVDSKFETYVKIAVNVGQMLFAAFLPILQEVRDNKPSRLREVNLAGEARSQRGAICNRHFQDMALRLRELGYAPLAPGLHTLLNSFMCLLNEFYRLNV